MRTGRVSLKKPRGRGPEGATQGATHVYQSYMELLEVSAPDWHSDAECSRHSEASFYFKDSTSKPALEAGLQACNSCIVKKECLETASPSDRYWTTRGGILPGVLNSRTIPSAEGVEIDKPFPERPCGRGHTDWAWNKSRSAWYCRECSNMRARAYRKGETIPLIEKPETCPRGHSDFKFDKDNHRICRPCKLEADRLRKRTGSGALPPATM